MSIQSTTLSRVSNLMLSNTTTSQLDKVQQQLLDIQQQISTGKRLNQPSDDTVASAMAQHLQKTLDQRQGFLQNLQENQAQLSQVDSTLTNLTTILQQVQSVASQNAGSDASASQRAAAAQVVQSQYTSILQMANSQLNGVYLFGGDSGKAPYTEALGGVQFTGSNTVTSNAIDTNINLAMSVSGASIFGSASAPTGTSNDLQPQPPGPLTNETSLANLMNGAGLDVSGGLIISNGSATKTLDFTGDTTVGDVLRTINNAGLGVTAQINPASNGIEILNSTQGTNLTVSENTGTLGATLGVLTTSGPVQSTGIFGALLALQNALQTNNTDAITAAASQLQSQMDTVIRVHGQAGALLKQVNDQTTNLQDQNTATQSLLSQLTDTDMTTAVSKFQLLQNTLQGSLATTAKVMNLSLLNFLQ